MDGQKDKQIDGYIDRINFYFPTYLKQFLWEESQIRANNTIKKTTLCAQRLLHKNYLEQGHFSQVKTLEKWRHKMAADC